MSRGPGIVQTAILSSVDDESWLNVDDIDTTLNGGRSSLPTVARRESIRRAMRRLASQDMVRSRHNDRGELEVSACLDPAVQWLLDEVHEIEAAGGDGFAYMQQLMDGAFKS